MGVYEGYKPGCIARIVDLHIDYYAQHWGFGQVFEAGVAEGLASFVKRYDTARDRLLLALDEAGGVQGSCILDGGLDKSDVSIAKLRWIILSDTLRGTGLGRRMLQETVMFAEQVGYDMLELETFEGLEAAIHLYEALGFKVTERSPDQTLYGPPVTGLTMQRLKST